MRKIARFLMRPAVALYLPIVIVPAYVLSFGPVIWLWYFCKIPSWTGPLIRYLYSPLAWVAKQRKFVGHVMDDYIYLWSVPHGPQMQQYGLEWPNGPPLFAESAGILVAAWFVWNGVRWLNQRQDCGKIPALQDREAK